jgi:hypothetical protein
MNCEIEFDNPRILDILKEIKDANGKVNEFMNSENLIKVMSRISNYIRYDIISKNEVITYKVSVDMDNNFDAFFNTLN